MQQVVPDALSHVGGDLRDGARDEELLEQPAFRGTRGGALPTVEPGSLPVSPVDLPWASPEVDVLIGHTAQEGTFFFRSPWRPSRSCSAHRAQRHPGAALMRALLAGFLLAVLPAGAQWKLPDNLAPLPPGARACNDAGTHCVVNASELMARDAALSPSPTRSIRPATRSACRRCPFTSGWRFLRFKPVRCLKNYGFFLTKK